MNRRSIQIQDQQTVILPNGPVGVSISGGADSALLLYIVLDQTDLPVHLFSTVSGWLESCEIPVIHKICEYMEQRFPGRIHNLTISFSKSPDHMSQILFKQPISALYASETIKSFLHGTTLSPSIEQQVSCGFPGTLDENIQRTRDPNIKYAVKMGPGWYGPLKNIDKKQVAELYKRYNIEDLFDYTRSCVMQSDHCGHCWWCHERMWAFGRL